MAVRTSIANGNWSAAGTWDTGVPINGDKVYIAHTSAAKSTISTDAAGYAIGATAYLPYESVNTVTASGLSFLAVQEPDTVYNTNAIDGSTVTEFSADYPNIQIDINDPDYTTSIQRLYAWFKYNENLANGIRYFFGGLVADDQYNYRIVTNTADLLLDNTVATPVVIAGARIYRDDGATVIAALSNSIQMDPDKAYIANADNVTKLVKGLYGK